MTFKSEENEIEKGAAEYEKAIHQTGFGRYNLSLIFLCGASILTVLVETLGIAYILPAAQCDLNLTISDKSIISSVGFLGIVISSLFWGFLADTIGRKKVLLISCLISAIFGIASSLVYHIWLFILFRFINGFFVGCPASIIITYAGEFHSDQYRAKAISWIGSFIALTLFYSPSIAWLILPMEWSFPLPGLGIDMRPWRLLIILFSLPSLLVCLSFLRYPESPKYLWSVGRSEECLNILKDMYVINTKKERSSYPRQFDEMEPLLSKSTTKNDTIYSQLRKVQKFELNTKPEKVNDSQNSSKSMGYIMIKFLHQIRDQIVPLVTMPFLPNMLLTSSLQLGIQASAQGVFMWIPEIFNKFSLFTEANPTTPVTICQAMDYGYNLQTNLTSLNETEVNCSDFVDEEVFKITLIFGVLATVIFIVLGFVINIIGKKLLLVIILLITGVSGIILNFMDNYESIVAFLIIYLMTGPCINIALTIQVELFPTEHRGKAVAISQMMGRCGAMLGSLLTGFIIELYCPAVFYVFSAILLALIIVSLLLPVPLFISRTNTNQVKSTS